MKHIILTNEQHASLIKAERDLHDVLPDMDKAEECGIDCQEFRRLHGEAMERIEALKRNFGPNSR